MDKQKAIDVLVYLRDIDKMIVLNTKIITDLQEEHYNTVKSPIIDDMPKSIGGVSSPVERTALNIPRSVSKTIDDLKAENERLEKLKTAIEEEIKRLNYNQRCIIVMFYLKGKNWEYISQQTHYSPRQCRNIRDKALKKLSKYFTANKQIEKFNYPEK